MQEALLSGFKSSGLWTTHATTHIIFSDTVKRNRLADRWAEILGLELEQVNEPAVVWSFERELLKNLNRWDEKVDPRSRMALSYQ